MKPELSLWDPNSNNLLGWWEEFWASRTEPYGPPSTSLIAIIESEVKRLLPREIYAVDIASGNGRYAIPLAKLGCDVTAVEWAESGASTIRNGAEANNITIRIEQSDYTKVCHDKRDFHIVVCSGLLEEIDSAHHPTVVEGFANWTRPGGLAIIKYCLELEGRGTLVEDESVEHMLRKHGMEILTADERRAIKTSAATKIGSRTGTVIARRSRIGGEV